MKSPNGWLLLHGDAARDPSVVHECCIFVREHALVCPIRKAVRYYLNNSPLSQHPEDPVGKAKTSVMNPGKVDLRRFSPELPPLRS